MKFDFLDFSWLLNNWSSEFVKQTNEVSAINNMYEKDMGSLTVCPQIRKFSVYQASTWWADINYVFNRKWWTLIAWYSALDWETPYYYFKSSTWGSWTWLVWIEDLTELFQPSLAEFLWSIFMVWYDLDAWDFAVNRENWSTWTDNLTWMPKWKYLYVYKNKLYVCNTENWNSYIEWNNDPVAWVISWDTNVNFREFNQWDWDEITGVTEVAWKMIIFKRNSMWYWDEYESKKITDIWCIAPYSLVNIFWVAYWLSESWIFMYDWSAPVLISRKVDKFIKQIPWEMKITRTYAWEDRAIWVKDDFYYRLYIWTVTVDWVEYKNAWICYDTLKRSFHIRTSANKCFFATEHKASQDTTVAWVLYKKEWDSRAVFWTTAWYVVEFSDYWDMDSYWSKLDPVYYWVDTNELTFDNPSIVKNSPKMVIYTKNPKWMRCDIEVNSSWTYVKWETRILNSNVEDQQLNVAWNILKIRFYWASIWEPSTLKWYTLDVKELEERNK